LHVVKSDGTLQAFEPSKARQWVNWALGNELPMEEKLDMEYTILRDTMERISDRCTTADIHQAMISSCLEKKDIKYSQVAANLEMATLYKNMEKKLRIIDPSNAQFMDIFDVMVDRGHWKGDWTCDDDLIHFEDEINEVYIELAAMSPQVWTVKQWADKYSLKEDQEAIETPAMGILALALSIHGPSEKAYKMAYGVMEGKQNYPTPMLNGCRNGNYNLISCCVIEADDSTLSIDIAELIASQMTARKAGIGINLLTRSKGDDVKNGAVKHLGKHPLYASLQSTVKKYTQETRGGSATTTYNVIDPEILEQILWKTQRMDLARRLDKLDFELAYNDAFGQAVIHDRDWYLFSYSEAPEVWDAFHLMADEYNEVVRKAILRGAKYTKINAIDLLVEFGKARWETGRQYINNLSETNRHTPFLTQYVENRISQSNLCEEIALPTRGFTDLWDLLKEDSEGEVAFCTIAAGNVEEIDDEEYMDQMETILYTLNRGLDLAAHHAPTPSLKASLLRRRSLGVGITGMAGRLYKKGLDYDSSPESIEEVTALAELHYYALLRASQKYAKETGVEVTTGIDNNWLPIDTRKDNGYEPRLDWEALRGIPRANSVLVAHMPTESSSAFSGATNGLYPSRKRVVAKKARTGKIQFISKYFDPEKHMSVWDPALRMENYYGAVQGFSDQAISADYWTDFYRYEGAKFPAEEIVLWFVRQYLSGTKTAYYQNFKDNEEEDSDDYVEPISAADCCKL